MRTLTILIVSFLAVYAAVAFVVLDADPRAWTVAERLMLLLSWAGASSTALLWMDLK